jgi:hypothetical protein
MILRNAEPNSGEDCLDEEQIEVFRRSRKHAVQAEVNVLSRARCCPTQIRTCMASIWNGIASPDRSPMPLSGEHKAVGPTGGRFILNEARLRCSALNDLAGYLARHEGTFATLRGNGKGAVDVSIIEVARCFA